MGKMTRRMQRQARRRLGAIVDRIFHALERLEEEAMQCDDPEAMAYCEQAFAAIDATLTPDGLPTGTTAEVLPDVLDGPFSHAMRRLRPDLPLPSDAENAA
jgi:hypothetical protein